MSQPRSSKGQVLVISAASMIVLMAIGAIVIDLGMSWMLHRQEQNAADPGALAAANYIKNAPGSGTKLQAMETEACFYAQKDGFFAGDTNCALALGNKNLDVNWPPTSTLSGEFRGRPGYVEVIINASHPSFFGALFGRNPAWVKTAAVAALTNGTAASGSLMALGESCANKEGGGSIIGGATVNIHPALGVTTPGGYINVNAPCGGIGNPQACDGSGGAALDISGNSHLTAPHAYTTGGCAQNGGGVFSCQAASPCLDEQSVPSGDPLAFLPKPWTPTSNVAGLAYPVCPSQPGPQGAPDPNIATDNNPCVLDSKHCPTVSGTSICTMEPGVYYAGWDIKSKVRLDLKPGMYVLAGGGIRCNNTCAMDDVTGTTAGGVQIPARATIFSTDGPTCNGGGGGQCEGAVTFQSSGTVDLRATDSTSCGLVSPQICPWRGILLWQDGSVPNPQPIDFTAGSNLTLYGTIYAPKSYVTINGNNGTSGCSGPVGDRTCLAIQIISLGWKINGGASVDMPYDPAQLYSLEQRGLVH